MILTKLKEYADTQMELPPAMYNKRTVAWLISLTVNGTWEDCICWKDSSKKETKNGRSIMAPDVGRTVGVKPKLLVDTGEYVLGIGRPTTKPERLAECHEQFKALVNKCAEETEEDTIKAIAHFLTSPDLEKARVKFSQLLEGV
jgi:CRISPR-associated protein Csd1